MLRRFLKDRDYPRHLPGLSAFITVLLLPLIANGQQYQLRHYGVADGLAHGAVISIYQDRKGYLWFSTREGLSRFDGYTFVNYGERDGLGNRQINDVIEDQQGRVWVATNNSGVALLLDPPESQSGRKFKTFLIVDRKDEAAKAFNAVNRMLADSQNNLWALTDGGLFRASLSDPQLKFEAVKTDPLSYAANAALRDHTGRLWFGYGNELVEVDSGRPINHGALNLGQSGPSEIVSIVQDHAGRILVAYLDGLYEFVPPTSPVQRGQWRGIDLKLKPKQRVRKMLVDSSGDLYVGTTGGLIKRTPAAQQTEIASRHVGPYTVFDLLEDRDLNIWISAWTNGVYKLAGEMTVNYTNSDGSNLRAEDIFEDGGVLKSTAFGEDVVEFGEGRNQHRDALEYPPTIDYSVEVTRVKREWLGNRLGGHYGKFRRLILRLRSGREVPLTSIASIDDLSKGLSYYEDENGKLWVNKSETDGKLYRVDVTRPDHLTVENLAAEFHDVGYGVQM